jgi:hypothetical protein
MTDTTLDALLLWSLSLWPFPPVVRAILAIAAAWALPYAIRRWVPGIWRRLESWGPADGTAARVFLSLPSVLAGALTTALTAGSTDLWRDVWMASLAPLAPLLHHVLKASSAPYRGDVRDQDWQANQEAAAKVVAWDAALKAGRVDGDR